MLLKYQPTKNQMFTVSQATKKENILGAESEHWWVSSRSRAAAANADFCWKIWARGECLYIILSFQHLRASFRFLQDTETSVTAARSVYAFHLILIFPSSSNVVKANIYRLLNVIILMLQPAWTRTCPTIQQTEFAAIWGPQRISGFAVLLRMNFSSPFSWSSFPI